MEKIAVIKTGGKQYKVQENDIITIEKLSGDEKEFEFENILGGGKVKAKLVSEEKADKVIVFKFHRRKRYQRNKGHRQTVSKIKIESIG